MTLGQVPLNYEKGGKGGEKMNETNVRNKRGGNKKKKKREERGRENRILTAFSTIVLCERYMSRNCFC